MKISKCSMCDLEKVALLYDETVLYLTEHINYPKWKYKEYPSYDSAKTAIESGDQYMCTDDDGNVVGAFMFDTDPRGNYDCGDWSTKLNTGEYKIIHAFAVHPALQGKGVGEFMVGYCLDSAKKDKFKAIRLDAVPANVPARRLYEKMGFQFAGEKDLERNMPEIPTFTLYEFNF